MPSGEKATDLTSAVPSNVRISCPVAASQSLRVLSSLPESKRVPSGENATEVTLLECPSVPRHATLCRLACTRVRAEDADQLPAREPTA